MATIGFIGIGNMGGPMVANLAAAGFTKIDYLTICDAETLQEVDFVQGPARVLAAAFLGTTRLIDNVPVE